MQVLNKTAALVIDLCEQPRPPLGQSVVAGERLLNALVLDRRERARRNRIDELEVVRERLVVDKRAHKPLVIAQLGDAPPRARNRRPDRLSGRVDPSAIAQERQLERWVGDGVGDARAQLVGDSSAAAWRRQALERARHVQAPANQADEEGERDQRDRPARHPSTSSAGAPGSRLRTTTKRTRSISWITAAVSTGATVRRCGSSPRASAGQRGDRRDRS